MTQSLLLELGCEDLPARFVVPLSNALTRGLADGLARRGVAMGATRSYATPRRLAVVIEELGEAQPDQVVDLTGPAVSAALKDGQPTQAALGFARRALDEALLRATTRKMFNQTLADFQLTQAKLGEMAALVDSAALLTYRAAWLRDTGQVRVTAEAAMAKMTATENAQRVIDMALQLHGGRGVEVGSKVESLYRDIRSLRIYEGATEVQQLIIGKAVLQE